MRQKRFDAGANKVRTFNMKMTSAAAANVPLVQIVVSVALALIIYLAVRQPPRTNDSGRIRVVSDCVAAGVSAAAPPDRRQPDPAARLAAAESVFRLIDERPESDTGTREIGRSKGKVEFRPSGSVIRGAHARRGSCLVFHRIG